ncbi:MAG: tRNA (adenosine(37)-N6)-threonylcarbamoyltransferase complex dimerization subunit type 1 TsaB [Ignavibacteria bacterium]|nr:tRNA (adenosine(37)-N6)-threonylcarbamoyltransferase complex dimerization subunit type 1 TsaB [Ignavibacteria bacterium]
MIVLGIETATAVCGTALIEDRHVRAERSVEAPHVHSEKLMTLIDECLQSSGMELRDCDGIAISIGPGSFTGLRIGLSVAKGLAYAVSKPIVSALTLEALAWRAMYQYLAVKGDLIMPMIDARRDEVYTAVYRHGGNILEEVKPSCAMVLKEMVNLVDVNDRVIVLGDGVEKFQEHLAKNKPNASFRVVIPPRDARLCSPVTVASLGREKLERGTADDVASLEPLYVKDFYTLVKTQHQTVTS